MIQLDESLLISLVRSFMQSLNLEEIIGNYFWVEYLLWSLIYVANQ